MMLDTFHEPETDDLPDVMSDDSSDAGGPCASPSDTRKPQRPQPVLGQCFHQITSGHYCNAPALRGEYFCRHHFKRGTLIAPPNTRFEMPEITDRESLRHAVLEIASRVGANSLDIRRAGIILYSLQIALSTFPPLPRPKPEAPKEAPTKAGATPEDPQKLELWARTFIEGIDIQRNPSIPVDPNSFFAYPGDLLPKDGKVHVGHSCYAPPGWKPGDDPTSFPPVEKPSMPQQSEEAESTILPTLRACREFPVHERKRKPHPIPQGGMDGHLPTSN